MSTEALDTAIDACIDAYLDGEATAEQLALLTHALAEDAASARRLIQRARVDMLARESLAAGGRERWQRRRSPGRTAAIATLLVVVAALAAWALSGRFSRAPRPAEQAARVEREPAIAADSRGSDPGANQASPAARRQASALPGDRPLDGMRALMVVGNLPLSEADTLVRGRLERLGLDVTPALGASLESVATSGYALVYISASVSSRAVSEPIRRLRDLAVPVVVVEPWLLDELALTGLPANADGLTNQDHTEVRIVAPDHALAAGLRDTVTIAAAPVRVAWGMALPTAVAIASLPRFPERLAIFGYEHGAQMAGIRAPARRVSLFLSDQSPPSLTPDGWALFDAAIRWAVGTTD